MDWVQKDMVGSLLKLQTAEAAQAGAAVVPVVHTMAAVVAVQEALIIPEGAVQVEAVEEAPADHITQEAAEEMQGEVVATPVANRVAEEGVPAAQAVVAAPAAGRIAEAESQISVHW